MLNRAYSIFEVKSVDAERRVISGIATTPEPDRVGDIVEPKGVRFKNPLPLLLFHDSRLPVGHAKFSRATDNGIEFEATLADPGDSAALKARIDEAWASVKAGLIRGVSIGFRVMEDGIELLKSGGYRFTNTEVMELSLVVIPANAGATITGIKSIDAPHLAASGNGPELKQVNTPGVSGNPVVWLKSTRPETQMKPIAEQISAFEAKRAANTARMNEIQSKASDEGRSKDESEKQEFDTLKMEQKSIDAELVDLRDMAEFQKVAARPVSGATPAEADAARGGHPVITVKENLPPGIGFARFAIAKVAARLEGSTVMEIAKQRWPDHANLHRFIQKAAVPAGTTTDATWASPLVYAENLPGEFLEYLRPRTLLGRIPNLRKVPFNIRFTSQTSGAVANWVGQGRAKPVTSFSTAANTLAYTKIAAIAVITDELARFSSPSAEMLVRDELARAVIERMDIDFIDPAQAAVANVNPASITNGLVALSSAGTSEANIRTDLTNLLSTFVEANIDPTNLVLLMPNTLALGASLMVNSLGQPSFPGLNVSGGALMGIPVITSQYLANASGSGNLVVALNASDIFVADDGQVTLDASREATIEMSDAPLGNSGSTPPVASSVSPVSMFQTNSIAIRAERYINWVKGRSSSVVYMDDVNWGSVGSPA